MTTTRTARTKGISGKTATELDIYAAEFAKLVDRHSPSRSDTPSEWLRRLPDEAYHYYREGVASFGADARTPIERRGRLYLIHTALLFLWMNWGKQKARERFQCKANESTRRAASLVTLERYRRAGVLAHVEPADWFFQPVAEWSVSLRSAAVETETVGDPALRAALRNREVVDSTVAAFSRLRMNEGVPGHQSFAL
jgi:hypothetical protein